MSLQRKSIIWEELKTLTNSFPGSNKTGLRWRSSVEEMQNKINSIKTRRIATLRSLVRRRKLTKAAKKELKRLRQEKLKRLRQKKLEKDPIKHQKKIIGDLEKFARDELKEGFEKGDFIRRHDKGDTSVTAMRAEKLKAMGKNRFHIKSRVGGRWKNNLTFHIFDYNSVIAKVQRKIKSFASKFKDRKFSIEGDIESDTNQTPDTPIGRKHKKLTKFDINVDKFLRDLTSHIDQYESLWSSENGFPTNVVNISITIRFIENSPPPPASMCNDINCILKAIYEQTKKKSAKKEGEAKVGEFLDCWEELEEKYDCRLIIIDSEGDIWRNSTRKIKRKKYQPDVIIRLHNYHVERVSQSDRRKILPKIKSIELEHRCIDNIWHAKRKEQKDTETQDQNFTNIYKKSKKTFTNKYISVEQLEKKHIKYIKNDTDHHVIETRNNIIGLIVPQAQDKPDIHYKTKSAFRYMDDEIIDYENTSAWSLSSHIRNEYKDYLIHQVRQKKLNRSILQQIPNENIFKMCQDNQKPLMRVFNRKLDGKGMIQQIDANRSYRNSAVGNIPKSLRKHYYHKFPDAPRNVKKYNLQFMRKNLMDEIYDNYYGMALFKYDQTDIKIPTWFCGKAINKGVQYTSIPAMKYMFDKGAKIWLIQLHYSKTNSEPFKDFFEQLDAEAEQATNYEHGETQEEFEEQEKKISNHKALPNMLIGGLNRSINKAQVFTTFSKEEFDRFVYKFEETNRLITKYETRVLTDKEKNGKVPNRDNCANYTQEEEITEFIIHYQDTENLHFDSWNMSHLSKYAIDYQKIVIHAMTEKVCEGDIKRLGCINTDSISYIGKNLKDIQRESRMHSDSTDDFHKFFHEEAFNYDEFIGVSNGLRYMSKKLKNNDVIEYQRHSGYTEKLKREKFIELLELIPHKQDFDEDDEFIELYIKEHVIGDYDTKYEMIKLETQLLTRTIAAAGFGKSDIVKWMKKKETKFKPTDEQKKLYKQYKEDEILTCTPTHQARKIINREHDPMNITNAKLRFSLEYYTTSKLDISKIKAIVFDECSMQDRMEFERLDHYLRKNLINRPFGGLDIYICGDFKQLKPYKGKDIKFEDLLFNSKLYPLFTESILTTNHRQKNQPIFQKILTKIRGYYKYGGDIKSNHDSDYALPKILSREEIDILNRGVLSPHDANHYALIRDKKISSLCWSNKDRQHENEGIHGELRINSKVLFRKTFKNKGICNGDEGIITDMREEQEVVFKCGKLIDELPTGLYEYKIKVNGKSSWFGGKYFIEPDLTTKESKSLLKKYADICLDYSTTIFCVQGKSIDKIIFDPSVLNVNLLYVAMSRAVNIDNIYLKNSIPYISVIRAKQNVYDDDDFDVYDYNNEPLDEELL